MAYRIRDSAYIPRDNSSSSESEEEMIQSIGYHHSSTHSQELTTPACNNDLKCFHFPMPRKTSRPIPYTRKRKFHGNRHTKGIASCTDSTDASQSAPELQDLSTPASRKLEFPFAKRKANKSVIQVSSTDDDTVSMQKVSPIEGNLLISSTILQNVLTEMALCSSCQEGNLKLYNKSGIRSGCSMYIIMRCEKCFVSKTFWTLSGKFQSNITVGNTQIKKRNEYIFSSVLGGRLVGLGWQSLKFYHSTLGIPQPCASNVFNETLRSIAIAAEEIAHCSMERARDSLKTLLDIDSSVTQFKAIASYDGSYQQRGGKAGGGHSRYCFAAAISTDNKRVLSYGIACNSCSLCTEYGNRLRDGKILSSDYKVWLEKHKLTCPAEFSHLSSVQLESAIAPQVVQQALERGVIFSGLVCDGDTKTHDVLSQADIYHGIDNAGEIQRIECLAHVCKRLKANLVKKHEKEMKLVKADKAADIRRMAKQGTSSKQIAKVVTPEYRGKLRTQSAPRQSWSSSTQLSKEIKHLSPSLCGQIASYYRLAIQRNEGDVPKILRAIKAIPLHLGANDDNAEDYHRYCPFSSDSWCQYQHAKYNNEETPHHPNYLSPGALKQIQAVFEDFQYDSTQFIERVAGGHTSNQNESLHNVLYSMVSKTVAIGYDTMRLASALAVIRYNDGYGGIQQLYNILQIEVTPLLSDAFLFLDRKRVKKSVFIKQEQVKRFLKKSNRAKSTTAKLKKYGPGYSSGRYSAAQKSHVSNSDLSSDDELDIQLPTISQPASSFESDSCAICNGTKTNGLVGIGLGFSVQGEEIHWIKFSNCQLLYHLICLGQEITDIEGKDDWYCYDF